MKVDGLYAWQAEVLKDNTRSQTWVLHRRAGKTIAGCFKILMNLKKDGQYHFIYPIQAQARDVVVDPFIKLAKAYRPELYIGFDAQRMIFHFRGGISVYVRGSELGNVEKLRGGRSDGAILDEYSDQDPRGYAEVVRPMLIDRQGFSVFSGTLKGKNHLWERYLLGLKGKEGYKSYLFRASETGIIPKEELESAKEEQKEDVYRQEFECEPLYYAGIVYKEFSEVKHFIEPFELGKDWKRYIILDHGIVNPTAILYCAVDYDGNLIIYDEYYERERTIKDHAEAIKNHEHKSEVSIIADPSTFAKNQQQYKDGIYHLTSVAEEYREHGILFRKADNEVLGGIERVRNMLRQDRIKVFNTCHNFKREIDNYSWKANKGVFNKEEIVKLNDHLMDCLRYAVNEHSNPTSRPERPAKIGSVKFYQQLNETL